MTSLLLEEISRSGGLDCDPETDKHCRQAAKRKTELGLEVPGEQPWKSG